MKITITQALNELKLYDNKITKARSASFASYAQTGDKAKVGTKDKAVFKKETKANLQSIKDLISNRNKMKGAIVLSNAMTNVTINGETMTVAEAIERKTSIEYEERLLDKLSDSLDSAKYAVEKHNEKVDAEIAKLSDNNKKDGEAALEKEELELLISMKEKNKKEVVCGFDIEKEISALFDKTQGFLAEVDTVLTLSNATTFIDVSI